MEGSEVFIWCVRQINHTLYYCLPISSLARKLTEEMSVAMSRHWKQLSSLNADTKDKRNVKYFVLTEFCRLGLPGRTMLICDNFGEVTGSSCFSGLKQVFHCSLDPEQREHLIEVIEKLLKDKSTVSKKSLSFFLSFSFIYICNYFLPHNDHTHHWGVPPSSASPPRPSFLGLAPQCHGLLTPT